MTVFCGAISIPVAGVEAMKPLAGRQPELSGTGLLRDIGVHGSCLAPLLSIVIGALSTNR
jgi:hypothetical protein